MKNLTKTLAALFLMAGLAVAQQQPPDSPFSVSNIKATNVSPRVVNVQLTTTTLKEIVPAPTVPVPTSELLVTGTIPLQQLIETNILDSFMAVDLDGDNGMTPLLVRETEKGLRFDGVIVEPIGDQYGPQEPYQKNGEMKSYLLSPDAPWFSVLYYNPPALGLLLTHRLERPQVMELPNPHLQLVVFEHSDPIDVPRFLPDPPNFSLTIDGKAPAQQNLLYAWEPEIFQSLNLSPRWIRAYWIAVPLSPKPNTTQHNLQVNLGAGASAVGLYAQVNYSTEVGVRQRTDRSIGVIYSPKPPAP